MLHLQINLFQGTQSTTVIRAYDAFTLSVCKREREGKQEKKLKEQKAARRECIYCCKISPTSWHKIEEKYLPNTITADFNSLMSCALSNKKTNKNEFSNEATKL